jgi:excinuclease ABC subunit B
VELVAVLDADKEGFLRSDTSLIQTAGRAARHINGRVILYADIVTDSMKRMMDETADRREKQMAYNEAHHITPKGIERAINESLQIEEEAKGVVESVAGSQEEYDIERVIAELEGEMLQAADALEFERAAELRDEIRELRRGLEARPAPKAPSAKAAKKLKTSRGKKV